ncbi:MAG: ribose-5-phosphate isomerase RpiA [Beijerinckiaceae bacterium]
MNTEQLKRDAARAALALVEPKMRLGLGTGSTARHFVELLGERVAQGLVVLCVPTSEVTAAQARALSIPLSTLDDTPELDLTVDGADELDNALRLIKGGGAALLREKIVAAASLKMVVIADETKLVQSLGQFPLPIEVNAFGLAATRKLVERACGGCKITLRQRASGEALVTDGGHLILDAHLGLIDKPESLDDALLRIPGVVEHGLFLGLCHSAYLASPNGVAVVSRTAYRS